QSWGSFFRYYRSRRLVCPFLEVLTFFVAVLMSPFPAALSLDTGLPFCEGAALSLDTGLPFCEGSHVFQIGSVVLAVRSAEYLEGFFYGGEVGPFLVDPLPKGSQLRSHTARFGRGSVVRTRALGYRAGFDGFRCRCGPSRGRSSNPLFLAGHPNQLAILI
ncbi:hypothetical protein V498_03574, partial [Pseudogymnoascus sp. VKM F-4517 (FW-2822)]